MSGGIWHRGLLSGGICPRPGAVFCSSPTLCKLHLEIPVHLINLYFLGDISCPG